MTRPLPMLAEDEVRARLPVDEEAGFGAMRTGRGILPLKAMDVRGRIDGILAQLTVRQTFVNALDEPLEATYIFPLPDRAAVTSFRMEVAGRVVDGVLQERGRARQEYDRAIAEGHRASIAEEERPGVFTIRVGNLMPGEEATVVLSLTGPLPFADGEVTFRFPLVVAPRYIPGRPLDGESVGAGVAPDTDAVPDASRITPPVLLPGFPNPVRLALEVEIHETIEPVGEVRSTLHAVVEEAGQGVRRIALKPGARLDRDFVLRYRLGTGADRTALSVHPDPGGDGREGTFALTVVPPTASGAVRPRDLVFVFDRSGSMAGWKIVAARRALARMVDALGEEDRFAVLAFDDSIETPRGLAAGLVAATDRHRFRAVEFLGAITARGGTEMVPPLKQAVASLAGEDPTRDRVLVLVTDGQVGNENQILRSLGKTMTNLRAFTLGIDRAVNEGFLRRLAEFGGGACEIVESEERLDEAMDAILRQVGTPVLTGLRIAPLVAPVVADSLIPGRTPDLFAAAPVLFLGRYRGEPPGQLVLRAEEASGRAWSEAVPAVVRDNPAIAFAWARGQVRKLEDRYVAGQGERDALEREIVAISLRFGVLCRFTAYVAVDRSEVVNEGGRVHQVTQPVEGPSGWVLPADGLASARYLSPKKARRAPPSADEIPRSAPASLPPAPSDAVESVDSFLMEFAPPPRGAAKGGGVFGRLKDALSPRPTPQPPAQAPGGDARQRIVEVLDELRAALREGVPSRLDALRELASKLSTLVAELKALGVADAGLRGLRKVLDLFRKALAKTDADVSAIDQVGGRLEKALTALADTLPSATEDPAGGPRDAFWK